MKQNIDSELLHHGMVELAEHLFARGTVQLSIVNIGEKSRYECLDERTSASGQKLSFNILSTTLSFRLDEVYPSYF